MNTGGTTNDDATARPIRVLLVDDQKLVRTGFAAILSTEPDLQIVGQATNGQEALDLVAAESPDVVLMDVQMPVMDGIAATEAIIASEHPSKVIILTTFDQDDYVFAGLRAGASGFLLKNSDADHLIEAVRAVADGHALLSPEVTRRVIAEMTSGASPAASGQDLEMMPPSPGAPESAESGSRVPDPRLSSLTPRELEVLGLIGQGRSNAEIAASLFLGEATVKTHVSNLLSKLQLRDRVQAVVLAYEAGLILPGESTIPPPD